MTPGPRDEQTFPALTAGQIDDARRFASGPKRVFASGEPIYRIGTRDTPAWLVLQGSIEVTSRDGLNGDVRIATLKRGQFSGEVNELAGRPALTSGNAGPDGCAALPFDAAHLRALMVGSAAASEIVMRALILRRVSLLDGSGAGTVIIGVPASADVVRLETFLLRAGLPQTFIDIETDNDGRALIERVGLLPEELPLVVCPGGDLLKRPTDRELAIRLGIMPEIDPEHRYDVAIVGAGPAGLATAVYAASEGLSTIVLDAHAFGGQAGASARIENYLGFPSGISGHALAGRAFNQALKFGAEVALPMTIKQLVRQGSDLILLDGDDCRLRARSVVIASGARYRRPAVTNLAAFEGTGVSYWASAIEAKLCTGQEVALIGGGNSAGQAVVFLAGFVKRLHLVVRRALEHTMSRYLIDRIAALPNVEIHVGAEISSLESASDGRLAAATFIHPDGTLRRQALHHLFLFIGADPNTGWVGDEIATDEKGYIRTGQGPYSLQTNLPGVFAIGDVRAGSTKRVAAAVGEGAAVVAQLHAMLAESREA